MKTLKKLSLLLFVSLLTISCSKNDSTGNCTVCKYTKTGAETDATVVASLIGKYDLTMRYTQKESPFPDGTKATFTISEKELIVEISGQECITIKNPVYTMAGSTEAVFKDTCRDKIMYAVSINSSNQLNEINVASISGTWYGQFAQ